MARHAVVAVADLDPGLVLAPERYDPARRPGGDRGVPLTRVCSLVRATVSKSTRQEAGEPGAFVVVDTSAAREGFLAADRPAVPAAELGSMKKLARPGDVLVSRLRPYLRQVAYVDAGAIDWERSGLACSTEFYVLRSADLRSIAFLVPFLLSAPVQAVLAAAQEGGHHPRVNEATIRSLTLPDRLIAERDRICAAVERAAAGHRRAATAITALTAEAARAAPGARSGAGGPPVRAPGL